MTGAQKNIVYINGHVWRDVTHETVVGDVYSQRQIEQIGGDPRRLRELYQANSSDD